MVLFSSDGASINSDSNSGLIRLFHDNYPWLSFIWCFSQRFELSFKDALSEFFEPADTSLIHLFYLYSNSPKKHRKLKSLYLELQVQFEKYGSGVKLLKGSVAKWINYEICAMLHVIEKFGLYVQHLNSCLVTTKNSIVRATVEGKLKKLVDAKVLLQAAVFTDILADAKRFSLITQEKNINLIKMLDAVTTAKSNYERLLKKEYILNLLNQKIVTDAVKSNESDDGIPRYQWHKLMVWRECQF